MSDNFLRMVDVINAGGQTRYDRAMSQQDRDYTRSHEYPEEWPRSGLKTALGNLKATSFVPLTEEQEAAKDASWNRLWSDIDEQFAKDAAEMKAKYP